jgi:hypothetical protein
VYQIQKVIIWIAKDMAKLKATIVGCDTIWNEDIALI